MLVIYSAPSSLRTYIEWAIENVLGKSLEIQWRQKLNFVGTNRRKISEPDLAGSGAKLNGALASWYYLRFKIFEVRHRIYWLCSHGSANDLEVRHLLFARFSIQLTKIS